ncbi:hypothetical protein SMSP2_00324 [Limihaloglobus sulfuriphilus]|uniref:Uncharacterized protein n=1 Tax=Limihaloglobus sulfuriphilus TaxID=1851148 RepID=A0A1Q2MCG7_9BACT|nr:hypothetical protein [Limihaloglobus sulfuriphilus]AQQ69987.1 hypothetical protein SMSP2_00324 [Limihaloglobus sulfuriphilus]
MNASVYVKMMFAAAIAMFVISAPSVADYDVSDYIGSEMQLCDSGQDDSHNMGCKARCGDDEKKCNPGDPPKK